MDEEKFEQKAKKLEDEKIVIQQLDKNKGEAEKLLQDRDKMEHFLARLETKLSLIPVAGNYLSDIPVLISLVRAYVDKTYVEIPIGSILAIIGALIYFLSPVDLIPDIIPGVGYLDDVAVVGVAFKLVHDDVAEYKKWRDTKVLM